MNPVELRFRVKALAKEIGFDRCGIAPAEPIGRADYLRTWLNSGRAGSMEYMHHRFNERVDPRNLLEGARSVIVGALNYQQTHDPVAESSGDEARRGRVAMYAWGNDYHEAVRKKLDAMVDRMRGEVATPFTVRVCVDTAAMVEREVAALAGVGWIGKNTMVLHPELGSYFFLGEIVTTLEIAPDEPAMDHCGSCTACLEACPTGAFPAAYEMDASRCISYLTIEHRGDISRPFQEMMGDWVFGCDVCQEVCPFNRRAPLTSAPEFAIGSPGPRPALDDMLSWTEDDYRRELRGSAMKRAKLSMLKRNARIALNNLASRER